tara:strand:- start:4149 stop:4262 length:114 start_codon:yes stop_codon:yes gene_type:complete
LKIKFLFYDLTFRQGDATAEAVKGIKNYKIVANKIEN